MYKISVPIINETAQEMGLEKILESLRRLDAHRVFLALGKYQTDPARRAAEMKALKENCKFFHKNGLEVGAWVWAFIILGESDYTHMTGIDGTVSDQNGIICPSDDNFRKFAGEYIAEVAACGVDLIMYDDDMTYGYHDFGFGCACENHMKYTRELLGENISREELAKKVLYGGESKYRTAWQKSKGHYLELFAKDMRKAVYYVNPDIRLGAAACMPNWGLDGTDFATLARIFAGNTKPFMRLTGAPYWAPFRPWGSNMQSIIDSERMEQSRSGDIETMSEGDPFPRPRTACPASYLEIFDTALRACGGLKGILKYAVDYTSKPGYEDGYILNHEKNRSLYKEIDRHFQDKATCGVRIYERLEKFDDMVIPAELEGNGGEIQEFFFSLAAKMVSENSLPSTWYGDGVCGIAFAENVKAVPPEVMKKGLIVDLRAAQVLQEQGIDVGLLSVDEKHRVSKEYFDIFDNSYAVDVDAYDISVNENAQIQSHFIEYEKEVIETKRTVASYYYKNADGQQFLVFGFSAYANRQYMKNSIFGSHVYSSYLRSKQIENAIELFGGERLPAYSYGNPGLYIIAKKDDCLMAVGLWNIFADKIFEPVIELDREYSKIEFINCSGRLEGNKVILSEMIPFSFAGFEVK